MLRREILVLVKIVGEVEQLNKRRIEKVRFLRHAFELIQRFLPSIIWRGIIAFGVDLAGRSAGTGAKAELSIAVTHGK